MGLPLRLSGTEIQCIKPLFAGSSNTEGDRRPYKGTDMATSQMSGFIQHLRRTLLLRDRAGLTDGQLLTDYIGGLDERRPHRTKTPSDKSACDNRPLAAAWPLAL